MTFLPLPIGAEAIAEARALSTYEHNATPFATLAIQLRSLAATLAVGAAISILIELGQLAVATAYGFPVRVADVDDVLLNTVGVLAGYVTWRAWSAVPPVDSGRAVRGPTDR